MPGPPPKESRVCECVPSGRMNGLYLVCFGDINAIRNVRPTGVGDSGEPMATVQVPSFLVLSFLPFLVKQGLLGEMRSTPTPTPTPTPTTTLTPTPSSHSRSPHGTEHERAGYDWQTWTESDTPPEQDQPAPTPTPVKTDVPVTG